MKIPQIAVRNNFITLIVRRVNLLSHCESSGKSTVQSARSFSTVNSSNSGNIKTKKTMADQDFKKAESIYDFTVKDINGEEVSLDKYKGNVLLVVNIASKCGLTKSNYAGMNKLREKYGDKGFNILAFPCNQFSSQMPEADGEEMVCHLKQAKADFGDTFAKVDVNGDNAAPVYKYLKHKQGSILGDGLKWNFTKFLVDKNGQPVDRFSPTTSPESIEKKIDALL